MLNGDGLPRSEDGEGASVRALSRLAGHVLDLRTDEARARARVGGDVEGVGRERVQSTAGVVEQLEGLVTSVGERGGDLQVLDIVNSLGAGDLEGEAGRRGDSSRGSHKGDERSAEGGGEHAVDGVEKRRSSTRVVRLEHGEPE